MEKLNDISKKSGRITKGVLQVPEGVTLISNPGYLGKIESLRKVIVPISVKKIWYVTDDRKREKITYVFKSETPPVLYEDSPFPSPYELFRGSTVYVPANCKEKYIRQWQIPYDMKITMIE